MRIGNGMVSMGVCKKWECQCGVESAWLSGGQSNKKKNKGMGKTIFYDFPIFGFLGFFSFLIKL